MSWQPTANLATLRQRAALLRDFRDYFHELGFDEVQTPVLSRDTVVDRHLDPIEVNAEQVGLKDTGTLYLQTSPEFGMKRLLAAGLRSIYQIGPAFRAAERGPFHNPEFTMVEWYRVADDLDAGIRLLSDIVESVCGLKPAERTTYADAFRRVWDCDPLHASVAELSRRCRERCDLPANWSQDRDDWLHLMFAEQVQPQLGWERPTIVSHYPASQSALAKLSSEREGTAQRFELFIQGVELANGYNELLDASEIFARNEAVNHQRAQDRKPSLPVHSHLVQAMRSGLPDCSGCAMGLDRLLMVLTGAHSIDQVLTFPIERA